MYKIKKAVGKSRKKNITLFLAVLIVLFVVGFSAMTYLYPEPTVIGNSIKKPAPPPERLGFEYYVGNDFYVYYPEDWKLKKPPTMPGQSQIEIGFVSPDQEEDDTFNENVIITSDYLGKYSEKDYATVSFLRLQTEGLIPDFSIEDIGTSDIGDIKGYEIIFTGHNSTNTTLKYRQVYVPADKKIFVITYTATFDTYDAFLDEANEIVQSFKPAVSQKQA